MKYKCSIASTPRGLFTMATNGSRQAPKPGTYPGESGFVLQDSKLPDTPSYPWSVSEYTVVQESWIHLFSRSEVLCVRLAHVQHSCFLVKQCHLLAVSNAHCMKIDEVT